MSYNAVFEYDKTLGGVYGVRTWTGYTDKAEFEKLRHPDQIVIAENVSQDEALDLTSLTPEICRLIGAIEQAYIENPKASMEMINYSIVMANYAISYDREHIRKSGLARINAEKYIAHFKQMITDDPDSFKTASMKGIMVCLKNEHTGEVI